MCHVLVMLCYLFLYWIVHVLFDKYFITKDFQNIVSTIHLMVLPDTSHIQPTHRKQQGKEVTRLINVIKVIISTL